MEKVIYENLFTGEEITESDFLRAFADRYGNKNIIKRRKEMEKQIVVDKIDGYSKGNCYFSQRGHEASWEVGVGLRVRKVVGVNIFEDSYYEEGSDDFEEAINRYVLSEIEESLVKDFLNSEEEILYVDLSEWVHEPETN